MRYVFLVAMSLFMILACHRGNKISQNVYKAAYRDEAVTLHYSAVIAPKSQQALTAPFDAVLTAMPYAYGYFLKKQTSVFSLSADDVDNQFNDALMNFLKAKESYMLAKSRFAGTSSLWADGLIPKNTYLSEKATLDTERITFVESSKKLTHLLSLFGEQSKWDLTKLHLSQFGDVQKALSSSHHVIQIKAPEDGVLLSAQKTENNQDGSLSVGSRVKAGQVLGLLGDLNGISVNFDVSEMDINTLTTGMKASVTCPSLPNVVMQGVIQRVNSEASRNASSAMPVFSVIVEVDKLTPEIQKQIKVGMSANVTLSAKTKPSLQVPLDALIRKEGHYWVRLQDLQGKITLQEVTTGRASDNNVTIVTGLREGDSVVL